MAEEPQFAAYPREFSGRDSIKLKMIRMALTWMENTIYAWCISFGVGLLAVVYRLPALFFLALICFVSTAAIGIRAFALTGLATNRSPAHTVFSFFVGMTFGLLPLVLVYSRIGRAAKEFGIKQGFVGGVDRRQIDQRIKELEEQEVRLSTKWTMV